jgi:hypothetical protein
VPTYDIFGSNIQDTNTVVYKTLNDIKKITYLSKHSNIDLTYKFNETNANIINSNYKATDTIINSTPAYRIDFNKENLLENDRALFSITPLLSDTSNEIMSLDEMRLVNNQTSNVFDITLNNNIISRNYKFSCIFNNIYNIPSYLSDITTSNTYFTSNYAMIVDTNRGITSNIISLNNEIFRIFPR